MDATAEGIGGRKWSYQTAPPLDCAVGTAAMYLSQGKFKLAMICPQETEQDHKALEVEKVERLLVTAPQLWAAANELCAHAKQICDRDKSEPNKQVKDLMDMVAKAVGKQDWKDVLQA